MESNAKPNRILCSEAAAKLLIEQAPQISVKKRGKIKVKGKGDMVTFWVGDKELGTSQRRDPVLHPELWMEMNGGGDEKRVEFDVSDASSEERFKEDSGPLAPTPSSQGTKSSGSSQHQWRRGLLDGLNKLGADDEDDEDDMSVRKDASRKEAAPPPEAAPPTHIVLPSA